MLSLSTNVSSSARNDHTIEASNDVELGVDIAARNEPSANATPQETEGVVSVDSDDDSSDSDNEEEGTNATTGGVGDAINSVRRNRANRIIWCKRWIWFSREMRTFVIIALIAYTLYLQITTSNSHNWETSRLVGFAQPGLCVDSTERYGIREYDIVFDDHRSPPGEDVKNFKPLGFKDGSPDVLCFDANTLAKCSPVLQTINTGESMYEFKSFFRRDKRNYFPYSTFIDILGFLCLLLSILYEGPDDSPLFVSSGEMSSPIDRTIVRRVNHVITIILIIIIFVAASKQHFFYEEDCKDIYKDSSTKAEYCKYISSCGMILASVIRPEEFSVREYKATMITFGTFLIVGAICRCTVPTSRMYLRIPQQRRPYRITQNRLNRRIRALEEALNEEQWVAQQVQINVPLTSMTILSSIMFNNNHDLMMTRVAPLAISQERKANWKVVGKKELACLDEECTICLQHLSAVGGAAQKLTGKANQTTATPAADQTELGADNCDLDHDLETDQPPPIDASPSNEEVVRIHCDHVFHTRCIENWMLDHNTCPVCRKTI